jgi:hypothetical protein
VQLLSELNRRALESAGRCVADFLRGSWRAEPPPLESPPRVDLVTPLLLQSGAAGLGWWRASRGGSCVEQGSRILRQAFRQQAIHAALRERQVAAVFRVLTQAGVEAVLGKGWAIARDYPESALRPYGDIDLYVPDGQYQRAVEALGACAAEGYPVDLHRSFSEIGRSQEEVLTRARVASLAGVRIRIFGPEDHVRLLALHFLRHGGWRPLWLCDIAVATELREEEFDWDRLLLGDRIHREWIAATLGLARDLLGAELRGAPAVVTDRALPSWLVPTILRQWGDGGFVPQGARTPIASLVDQPRALSKALRARWPNGIEATVGLRGPFNELPRLPFQIAECVRRTAGFASKAAGDGSGRPSTT